MSQIKNIRANWIYDNGGYAYVAVPESLIANDEQHSIRFELKEINGEDSNLEVVIQRGEGTYHFKTDYYGEPLEELMLKEFSSSDELILFYDGRHGMAYFHLST